MRKDYNLEKRRWVITAFIVAVVAIYIARLFVLQVGDNSYKENADNNAYVERVIYPSRGMVYDRNDSLVVYNQPAYDLMVIANDIKEPFDTLDFCNTLQITPEIFVERMRKIQGINAYSQQVFMNHISVEDYGRLQEKLFRFPGFFIVQRVLRKYKYACAANVLGDIREVNQRDIDKDPYYRPGDYTGDLGIERSYEPWLRGRKGKEYLIRDALGKIKGRRNDGADDVAPIAGNDLHLSIDIKLQELGERVMRGKVGAIVCIEPKTGEILALVSSPSYDPSLLIGKERGKNYRDLVNNPMKPLYDRAIMAGYPPGSTFKPTQGLIFLQEGIVDLTTAYPCHRGFLSGGMRVGCHGHGSPIPLRPALQTSCNAYFCWGLKHMLERRSKYGSTGKAFEVWKKHMVSMGYGYTLGVDLPGEGHGFIPNTEFYNKHHGEGKWSAYSVISDAIGQGEILATPLQIANLAATIANRGYYITPHVVRRIDGVGILKRSLERHDPTIDKHYYDAIVEGMRMAVTGGTCRGANIAGLEVCGKTGTAQNPHGRDHSAFMGFAPMSDPKIAVCVYVENAGFGATFGVPIGAIMIEQYLNGHLSPAREAVAARMASTSLFSTKVYGSPKTDKSANDSKTTKTKATDNAAATAKQQQ